MKTKVNQITLSQAISGFQLNIDGRKLSQNTINDYNNTLRKFQAHIGDPLITDIEPGHISAFLKDQPVSKKTALNYHACLSSMWRWLLKLSLAPSNILKLVDAPKPEKRDIIPLTEEECKAILNGLEKSRAYYSRGNKPVSNTLSNIDRNRAIFLFFLDNGVRVTELCNIKISDLDTKNLRCYILGKGAKERHVPFSSRTGSLIWRYLTQRGKCDPNDYLFVSSQNRQLTRRCVLDMVETAGQRACVTGVHPHKLRHTFAISFLRAGGDPFTLQAILGHEDSEMTRDYVRLANTDIARVHRKASPVEFMRL